MDWNRLLINFFDPKSSLDSIKIVATIRIRTQTSNPNSICIENWLNLIEIGRKWTDFVVFIIIFNKNRLLIDFYDLLIKLFDIFIYLLIELDRKRSILYRNRDRRFGFVVRFRIGPKSTIEFGFQIVLTTTIWFATPNRISLIIWLHLLTEVGNIF